MVTYRQTDLEPEILSILKTDERSKTQEDTPRHVRNSFVESKDPTSKPDIPHKAYQIPMYGILQIDTHLFEYSVHMLIISNHHPGTISSSFFATVAYVRVSSHNKTGWTGKLN